MPYPAPESPPPRLSSFLTAPAGIHDRDSSVPNKSIQVGLVEAMSRHFEVGDIEAKITHLRSEVLLNGLISPGLPSDQFTNLIDLRCSEGRPPLHRVEPKSRGRITHLDSPQAARFLRLGAVSRRGGMGRAGSCFGGGSRFGSGSILIFRTGFPMLAMLVTPPCQAGRQGGSRSKGTRYGVFRRCRGVGPRARGSVHEMPGSPLHVR